MHGDLEWTSSPQYCPPQDNPSNEYKQPRNFPSPDPVYPRTAVKRHTENDGGVFTVFRDADFRYLKKTSRIGLVICSGILLVYLLFYIHSLYRKDEGCKFYTTQKTVEYVVGIVNSTTDGFGNLRSE